MHYILIAIIVISLVILLIKHVLFNPVVNSVISGIFFILVIIEGIKIGGPAAAFLIGIMILLLVDCIRDIAIAKDYYEDIEIEIDKLYMVKSLTSILTLGFARLVFLFIVSPIQSLCILASIKKKIRSGYPLPHNLQAKSKNYYYVKWIGKLEKKGLIVSNIQTLNNEAKIRRKKLESLYPKQFLAKVVDVVAGDKATKRKRKVAEERLKPQSLRECYAYLGTNVFKQYADLITDAMSGKGRYSVPDIKKFEELKPLHLTSPIYGGNTQWSEYFIIQALQPLVLNGTFEDDDLNDNDVFDNHAYRYTKSTVPIPIIDADNDPRFALDD